ncbi:hypothetical protein ABKN59_007093 [Abortiporus biennis]
MKSGSMASTSPLAKYLSLHHISDSCRIPAFYRLPVEILLHIRSFIPVEYVFEHLSFSYTCRLVRSVYEDEAFWEKARLIGGVGRPIHGHPLQRSSYRRMIACIANHASRCRDLHCPIRVRRKCGFVWDPPVSRKNSLHLCLDFNSPPTGYRIPKVSKYIEPLTPQEVEKDTISCRPFTAGVKFDNTSCDTPYDRSQTLSLVQHNHGWSNDTQKVTWEKYLHCQHIDVWMKNHLVPGLMFATEPPLVEMDISVLHTLTVHIRNPNGVTVWDVMGEMQRTFKSTKMTVRSLIKFYKRYCYRLKHLDFLEYYIVELLRDFMLETVRYSDSKAERDNARRVLQKISSLPRSRDYFQSALKFFLQYPLDPNITIDDDVDTVIQYIRAAFPSINQTSWLFQLEKYSNMMSIINDLSFEFQGLSQRHRGTTQFKAVMLFPPLPSLRP